jgi:hypothetical protein
MRTINRPWKFFGITPWKIFILSISISWYLCFFVWGLGLWGFLAFIPLGYAICLGIDFVFEYLLFPSLNAFFKKNYGPKPFFKNLRNHPERE